jgi:cytochrome c
MNVPSIELKHIVLATLLYAFAQSATFGADLATPATNARANTEDAARAQVLLKRAVAHYSESKDPRLTDFGSKGQFVDGELYVYVVSGAGVMLASGGPSSSLVGRNVTDQEDAAGKRFIREMLARARAHESGTVRYRWLNPVDNRVENKVAHFQKLGDRIIVVGHYIPRATPAEARALLARAVDTLRTDPDAAIKAFNEPHGRYVENDLYVFVVRISDKQFLADEADRVLIGTDARLIHDYTGRPLFEKMMAALGDRDQGEVDYAWSNPLTNKGEHKHTFLAKADDMLVGVGYYAR